MNLICEVTVFSFGADSIEVSTTTDPNRVVVSIPVLPQVVVTVPPPEVISISVGDSATAIGHTHPNWDELSLITDGDHDVRTDNPHGISPAQISAALDTHTHDTLYAAIDHNHDTSYAEISHDHDTTYAGIGHNHDLSYAEIGHNHDLSYSGINHDHGDDYAGIAHDHHADYAGIIHQHESEYASVDHDHGTYIAGDLSIVEIVKVTHAEYDTIDPKVATTLYIVEG